MNWQPNYWQRFHLINPYHLSKQVRPLLLVIIENKLDDSGKDVVWQALKYVSYCATLKKSEICEIFQQYLGAKGIASEKIAEFYDEQDYESIKLNSPGGDQRIIFVAANFRKEVTSTVLWLRDHDIDITCVKVTPYLDGDKLYLDAEQILPIQDIGDYQIRLTAKKKEEKEEEKEEEASRYKLRYRFWEKALPSLRDKTGAFNNVSPSKNNSINGASGHSGISFLPVIRMHDARVYLWIATADKDKNKSIFRELENQKDEIERALGRELDWLELPEQKTCGVCVRFQDYGLTDEENWDAIVSFLADNLANFIKVFKAPLAAAVKG